MDVAISSILEFNGFGAYTTFNEEENAAVSQFTQLEENCLTVSNPTFHQDIKLIAYR